MELISQHAKKIMEGCKERARDAGLSFHDESLEYIVTNRDLLELSPKNMIPTLYDYWVQDVEVLRESGRYELYPSNPYETVINTRPPISYYNDNNPDWLNVMIFYHVLGHIDFFHNNFFFRHTWEYDFTSQALSGKRLIAKLRSEKGRWVDYVIEFSRAIDNLVSYFDQLAASDRDKGQEGLTALDFYFDFFLQREAGTKVSSYTKEITRYNELVAEHPEDGEQLFIDSVRQLYREFDALLEKAQNQKRRGKRLDLLSYLMEYSPFLKQEENQWMLTVMEVVRTTSLYFQPQIRTKILNEGWASYWHEQLFLSDDRISGHEVDFSLVNAKVTSMPRVGLNPYALGMRLFTYLEQQVDQGRRSMEFARMTASYERSRYDSGCGTGREFIFFVRENYCDSMFVNTFIDQDFVDLYNLFVAGRRLNKERMTWQYYVKSKKAEDYRRMVADSLYHPPSIEVEQGEGGILVLNHIFEDKPLVRDFIQATMMGIEYLWGSEVHLHTSEPTPYRTEQKGGTSLVGWNRVRYTMKERELTRKLV